MAFSRKDAGNQFQMLIGDDQSLWDWTAQVSGVSHAVEPQTEDYNTGAVDAIQTTNVGPGEVSLTFPRLFYSSAITDVQEAFVGSSTRQMLAALAVGRGNHPFNPAQTNVVYSSAPTSYPSTNAASWFWGRFAPTGGSIESPDQGLITSDITLAQAAATYYGSAVHSRQDAIPHNGSLTVPSGTQPTWDSDWDAAVVIVPYLTWTTPATGDKVSVALGNGTLASSVQTELTGPGMLLLDDFSTAPTNGAQTSLNITATNAVSSCWAIIVYGSKVSAL